MAGHGKKNVDEQLLLALAAGASPATAAKQAGCSERTVRRRLEDAAFRARVSAMRSELVEKAVGRLATLGTIAADELHRLIQNGKDDNVKLGACRAVLGYMLAGHSNETLARQVEELRRQLEEQENESGNAPQAGGTDQGQGGQPAGENPADTGTDSPQPIPLDGGHQLPARRMAEDPPDDVLADGIEPMFG
jgi:hypothetical protein